MIEARAATEDEIAKMEEAYENDVRDLLLVGYHDEEKILGQLDSFQTIGFNMKQLLDGTNANRFVVTLATQEDINYFKVKEEE